MTETTLRDYLKRIDDYIKASRLEEATAHSAHILQRYPKNAAAYRALGRALMEFKRYDEAGEMFRRLLAAVPDDFAAHYQLSFIYDELELGNEALWHVERAFDQQSGNPTVNDRLRSLYKKYRKLEVEKIQLTAGAVSNQYIASGMHAQAIEILERTLQKMPDRSDLRLKLARALWQAGKRVDAAETALEVLKAYPYAVDANRILTELWLGENRPSDAQRYLSRIEDVDPYLAMQLATGKSVPADTFMLQEFDFQRFAAARTSQETPDWLDSLNVEEGAATAVADSDSAFDDDSWLADLSEEKQTTPAAKKKVTDDLSNLLPDDFDFPDSAGKDDTVKVDDLPKPASKHEDVDDLLGFDANDSTGLTGLFDDDADDDAVEPASTPQTTGGLTGMLAKLGGEEEAEQDDDDDWLRELAASNIVSSPLNTAQFEDILGDVDDVSVDDLFNVIDLSSAKADTEPVPGEGDDLNDPMAWLNSSGNTIDDDIDIPTTVDTSDALAWLEDTGIEFDDEAQSAVPTLFDENDPVALESAPKSPMAWLEDTDVDFEDDFDAHEVEETSNLSYYEKAQAVDDEALDNPMAWLAEADAELEDDDLFAPDLADTEPDPGMDWLTDDAVLDEMLDLHDLTDSDDFDFGAQAVDDSQVDMSDISFDEGFDFAADDEDDADEAEMDDLEWLSDDDLLIDELEEVEPDDVEADDVEADDGLAWLQQADTEPERATAINVGFVPAAEEDDPLAWLEDDDGIEVSDDDFDMQDEDDDPLAWLEDDDDIEVSGDDFELEDAAADLDWMGGMDDNTDMDDFFTDDDDFDEEDAVDVPPMAKSGMLDFLNTSSDDDAVSAGDWVDEVDADAAFADEADWLSALDDDDNEEEDEDEDALDWMSDDEEAYEDEESEPEAVEAALDWMAELSDDEEAEEGELDWMAELSDDDEEADDYEEEEAAVAEGELDWMSEFNDPDYDDEEQVGEAEPAAADWITALDASDDDEEAVAEGELDWMSDLSDDDEEADDYEEEDAVAEGELDWMSDLSDDDEEADDYEEEDAVAEGELDWMSDLSDDDEEADDYEEEDAVAEGELDWMSDLSDDEEEADDYEEENAVAEGELDWMSDLSDDDEEADDYAEEDAVAEAELDWMSDLSDDEEADDYAEEDAVAEGELDWMNEIDEEDYESEAISTKPDWAADVDDDYEAEALADDDDDFDEEAIAADVDWMSDLSDDEDYEDEEEELIGETIDDGNWLSEEAENDEVEEASADWGLDFDEDEEEYAATGMTDLLTTIRDEDEADDEAEYADDDTDEDEADWSDEDFDEEAEIVGDDAGAWGIDIDTDTDDDEAYDDYEDEEAIPLAEAEAAGRGDLDGDYEEELEFAVADNAPDWLNAMVPGLDLDYEADEDELLDEGFTESASHRSRAIIESESEIQATTSDFAWLQDIVDEETGIKQNTDEDDGEDEPARPSIRRFIFSKLPVWLRGDGGSSAAVIEEDFIDDLDDIGVPDYLSDMDDEDDDFEYIPAPGSDDDAFDEIPDPVLISDEDDDFDEIDDFDSFDDFDEDEIEMLDEFDDFDDKFDDNFEFDDDDNL